MSKLFTVLPSAVKRSRVLTARASLSPSDYRSVRQPVKSKTLVSLVKENGVKKGNEIGSDAYMPRSPYRFLKTVNITDSFVMDEAKTEFCRPSTRAVRPKGGSIILAKDGGGQGLGECCVYHAGAFTDYISAGVLSLEFEEAETRNYVLGMLK